MLARHFMLRDASQKQVIHKFSFIKSLDLSSKLNEKEQNKASERIVDSPDNELVTSSSQTKPSAIVSATETATTIDTNWYQSASENYNLSLAEIVKYSASANIASEHQPKERNYLGKILFSLAASYCLFVLWWLFGHHGSRLLTAWTGGKQIVLSKSDVEFLDYAERSLETIERDIETSKINSGEDDKVVYVPVYTPPTTSTLPSTTNLPLGALPGSNTLSSPAPIAKPAPEPLKIPSPPPLPAATSLKSSEKVAVPVIKSTLIGILELGANKSAALIKVQGQTRRVWLGEKINRDGWILESVGNQTANITYQGQVRSISVGETF